MGPMTVQQEGNVQVSDGEVWANRNLTQIVEAV